MSSDATGSAGFYEVLAWLEVNKKRVIIAAGAVIALAVVVSFFIWLGNQKEIEANAALLKLGLPLGAGEGSVSSAADYLKVANLYASTKAGERAALWAASVYFHDQKYAEAQAQFKKFQQDYPHSAMAPEAALGRAACLEAQTNLTEAISAYEQLATRYAGEPMAAQAKLALGRLAEYQKKPDIAFKYYDELSRGPARSAWAEEANDRRNLLLGQYPSLATNLPTAAPANFAAPPTNRPTTLIPGTNASLPERAAGAVSSPSNSVSRPAGNILAPPTHRPAPLATNRLAITNQPGTPATNLPKAGGPPR